MLGSVASKVVSAATEVSSSLPVQAGKTGFSETEALKHVKALTEVGPPPVDSQAHLNPALQYVFKECQNIKETADKEVNVELDPFPVKSGGSGLKSVVIRILPKGVAETVANAVLVSAHIDTTFPTEEEAGNDPSSVAVMLELARAVSQQAEGMKNAVIFFLNTGEEEGLNGAYSFITQHPWSNTIRLAIDLDSSPLFSTEEKQKPSIFQDFLQPGAIKSVTDFYKEDAVLSATDMQVYKEVGGLSGLDFALTDKGDVYHTKNDKFKLLKPGSVQHLGDNMLPFLLEAASSSPS